MCSHAVLALCIIGLALVVIVDKYEGFRSDAQKSALASRITEGGGTKPEFDGLRSLGLDGAEAYQVRQLWYNGKMTQSAVAKVL